MYHVYFHHLLPRIGHHLGNLLLLIRREIELCQRLLDGWKFALSSARRRIDRRHRRPNFTLQCAYLFGRQNIRKLLPHLLDKR